MNRLPLLAVLLACSASLAAKTTMAPGMDGTVNCPESRDQPELGVAPTTAPVQNEEPSTDRVVLRASRQRWKALLPGAMKTAG